jgi:signal transduction histidine kinase/ligand-binding sensor domain-containing protein
MRWLLTTLVLTAACAHALDPSRSISQYAHTAWRVSDGTPPSTPYGIAQTTDGYLWFATSAGLLRFDGVRFVPWQTPGDSSPPSMQAPGLQATRDGSLWIAGMTGLRRLHEGTVQKYPIEGGMVAGMLENARGEVWVTLAGQQRAQGDPTRICRVSGPSLECHSAADGLKDSPAAACCSLGFAQDAAGNFWLGNDTTLSRWRPGTPSSTYAPDSLRHNAHLTGIYVIQPDRDGSLWVGMGIAGREGGLQRFANERWQPFVTKDFDSSRLEIQDLLFDSHGSLWIGTVNDGLYRIHANSVDHFRASGGLTSDFIVKILEDREGSIWVTTSQGIDQFRDIRIATLSARDGVAADEVDSILARRDGTLCIGTSLGLNILSQGTLSSVAKVAHHQITSMFEDHAGRLWFGTETQMFVLEAGRFTPIRYDDSSDLGLATDMAEDAAHDMWIVISGDPRRLVRVHDGRVKEIVPVPRVPEARKISADPAGGLWLGLMSGDLAHYRDGQLDKYSYERKHAPMPDADAWVNQIDTLADGSVLAATGYGLIGWRKGNQRALTARNGLACGAVYSFTFDARGNLWLAGNCGYVRIEARELEKWWQSDAEKIASQKFDVYDGAHTTWTPFRGAARLPDGRLFFASAGGVQIIDPEHLGYNRIAPPVQVEAVIADRRPYPATASLILPRLTRDLEIDYTALSFVLPRKVSFRYKLEGLDRDWIAAGTRRQAFYTNLPPGRYRFHVIASNNDGVWNEAGASIDLAIPPMLYQTWWFAVFVIGAVIALAGALVAWRMRLVNSRIRGRLEERMIERERIARELHDTFLQSVQGLVLQFQSAMEKIPPTEVARAAMERALERADDVLAEGRERVADLRSSDTPRADLPQALQAAGEEDAALHGISFRFSVAGTPRPLHPLAREEIEQICREAMTNAFRHSRAQSVDLDLEYSSSGLSARVVDDGSGFDPALVDQSGKHRHFGLVGMRERAQRIDARLEVSSTPGAGTTIELRVPTSTAFRSA